MTHTRVLFTGGRNFADAELVREEFQRLSDDMNDGDHMVIIHGACHLGGADELVDQEAKRRGWSVMRYPVDECLDGSWPGAGPRRNGRMLKHSKPELVVALPGGRGTADMVRQAEAAGVWVRIAGS